LFLIESRTDIKREKIEFPREGPMKLHHYPKMDSLYIGVESAPGTGALGKNHG
jgi:hypothetical protein